MSRSDREGAADDDQIWISNSGPPSASASPGQARGRQVRGRLSASPPQETDAQSLNRRRLRAGACSFPGSCSEAMLVAGIWSTGTDPCCPGQAKAGPRSGAGTGNSVMHQSLKRGERECFKALPPLGGGGGWVAMHRSPAESALPIGQPRYLRLPLRRAHEDTRSNHTRTRRRTAASNSPAPTVVTAASVLNSRSSGSNTRCGSASWIDSSSSPIAATRNTAISAGART